MINPDFIKTFVTLAKTRHFTQTARLLHMTQPGVTQHIKKLEEHFGVPLIERGAATIVLTEAGRNLEEFGAKLQLDHERLRSSMLEEDPFVGTVRMSSPGSWGLLLLDVMVECAQKHPKLRVDLTTSPSSEIAQRVLSDEIDVGYSTIPSSDPRIQSDKFHSSPLWIVTPVNSRSKTLEDYKKLGLVWHPDVPYLLDRVFDSCFEGYTGIEDFPIRCSINQMARVLDTVEAGLGFSVLPSISVECYRNARKIRKVKASQCSNEQLYRLTLKKRNLPKRVEFVESQFIKALKS